MHRLRMTLVTALALALAACASGDGSGSSAGVDRTVDATLRDDMSIHLSESRFRVGETVRFEVTNDGSIAHEFYLGDADAQQSHADEMADMGMAHDESNGVSVEPGTTETLEFTFEGEGEILAGCHEPGHYEAGMVVSMEVSGR